MQCEIMIRQGLLRRVFAEWQRLCQERDWKTQLATRDNEIKRMDREVSHHNNPAQLSCMPSALCACVRVRACVRACVCVCVCVFPCLCVHVFAQESACCHYAAGCLSYYHTKNNDESCVMLEKVTMQ